MHDNYQVRKFYIALAGFSTFHNDYIDNLEYLPVIGQVYVWEGEYANEEDWKKWSVVRKGESAVLYRLWTPYRVVCPLRWFEEIQVSDKFRDSYKMASFFEP